MKSRLALSLVSLGALLLSLTGTASASGSGGAGGGGGGGGGAAGPVPNIVGTWYGGYQWTHPASFASPLHQMTWHIVAEDAAGNMLGNICYGTVANSCYATGGTVGSTGTVQFGFSRMTFRGSIAGTVTCLDGTIGENMAGTFTYAEAGGVWSFANCQT